MHTRAQAETFRFAAQCRIVGNGIDIGRYRNFLSRPTGRAQDHFIPVLSDFARDIPGLMDGAALQIDP